MKKRSGPERNLCRCFCLNELHGGFGGRFGLAVKWAIFGDRAAKTTAWIGLSDG